jgi:hypothetical protein
VDRQDPVLPPERCVRVTARAEQLRAAIRQIDRRPGHLARRFKIA